MEEKYFVHESSYIDEDVRYKNLAFLPYPEWCTHRKKLFAWTKCEYFQSGKNWK